MFGYRLMPAFNVAPMIYAFIVTTLILFAFITLRTVIHSRKSKVMPINQKMPVDLGEAVQRLSRAIQFQTISHQDYSDINGKAFLDMHAFLERHFPLTHLALKKETINRYSLLYMWEGSNPDLKPVMFTSHLDVVPIEPGTEGDWLYPPFQGKVTDDHIYGRGALDVQSGVMGIMESVEAIISQGIKPERTVYIAFGHDEEINGEFGASEIGRILKDRGVELEFLLDEGLPITDDLVEGFKKSIALVAIAEKGFLSVKLTVEAEGGHSSVPQGKTSIARLGQAIALLEANPMPARLDNLAKSTFSSFARAVPYPVSFLFANMWIFKGLAKRVLANIPVTDASIRTTTAATIFESGVKDNLIPRVASAVVNFRVHPSDTVEDVLHHVKKTINDPSIKIECVPGFINPSPVSDVKAESYWLLRKSIRQIFPDVTVTPALMVGCTDARHYTHLTTNIYRFSPIRASRDDLDRVHGTNERLSIQNYGEMIQFYCRMILNSTQKNPDAIRFQENTGMKKAIAV